MKFAGSTACHAGKSGTRTVSISASNVRPFFSRSPHSMKWVSSAPVICFLCPGRCERSVMMDGRDHSAGFTTIWDSAAEQTEEPETETAGEGE